MIFDKLIIKYNAPENKDYYSNNFMGLPKK